jgi:hypothetical protein
MKSNFGSAIKWDYAEAIDLTDAVQRIARTTTAAVVGTNPNGVMAAGSSIMVSHHIAARFRGGHPRTYWPSLPVPSSNDGDVYTPATVSTFTTSYNNWRDAILAALTSAGVSGPVQCAPRYTYSYTADANKHKFLKERTGYLGPFPIVQSVVSNQVRSQRRRYGP